MGKAYKNKKNAPKNMPAIGREYFFRQLAFDTYQKTNNFHYFLSFL